MFQGICDRILLLNIAVEVKFKTSFAPCSLLPAPFQGKDYVLNHTSLAISINNQPINQTVYG
ncbi:MAG: hypothetical protein F6K56_21525 [Moorea sp. SIO3G5]|nr:hypothetical protein [Moorena sp. SIO3G5]